MANPRAKKQPTCGKAVCPMAALYGTLAVRQFGPISLETVRAKMIEDGLCRSVLIRTLTEAI